MSGADGAERIPWLDWARTFALVNMAAFHFLFDLRMYGLPPGWMTYGPAFDLWAKGIAGAFLMLAGLSLWLAHGKGFRAQAFLRRLLVLVLAAAMVSIATYVAVPQAWVRFGILHAIALCSVFSIIALYLPWHVTTLVAAALLWWGPGLSAPAFDAPWLVWTGLGTSHPPMIDYEPVVPWLAPMLLGVAFGRLGSRAGIWSRLAKTPPQVGAWGRVLAWPGKHSLALYLIHQPVLIGAILTWAWFTGHI